MSKGTVRHLFPGGNTSLGFHSFYGNIIAQEEADRIYIIKGGPGVGKSTFMKKIGAKMQETGYDVEYLHCSSDNHSLDGVLIPALQTAFIDGTSPHVVDPKCPGAVDEILNFGQFWDDEGIRVHKSEILQTAGEISYIFSRAYKYLRAAAAVRESSAEIYAKAKDAGKLNRLASELTDAYVGHAAADREGRQRSLFASALTPDGCCNHLDSLLTADRIVEIQGGLGTPESEVLETIRTAALTGGYFVEAFYCALDPKKLEHLIVPDLRCAFTTANAYHGSKVPKDKTIDIKDFLHPLSETHRQDLEQNQTHFDRLLNEALSTIRRAKALHDKLETYYVPNIRFAQIDSLLEQTLEKLQKQA